MWDGALEVGDFWDGVVEWHHKKLERVQSWSLYLGQKWIENQILDGQVVR